MAIRLDTSFARHARRHRRPLAGRRPSSQRIIRKERPPSPSRVGRTSPQAAQRLLRRRHDRTDLLRRLTEPGMRPSGLERPRRVTVSGAMENAGNAGRPSIVMRRPKPPPTASSGGSGASMKDAGCRRGWTRAPTTRDGISGRAMPDRPQGGKFTPFERGSCRRRTFGFAGRGRLRLARSSSSGGFSIRGGTWYSKGEVGLQSQSRGRKAVR